MRFSAINKVLRVISLSNESFLLTLLQVVYSKYTDLLPKEVLNDDVPELKKPDEETVQEVQHFVSFIALYKLNVPIVALSIPFPQGQ